MCDIFSLCMFAILCAGVQYLLGGALITEPIRALLPQWAQTPIRCPACCGWWIGFVIGGLGTCPGWASLHWPWFGRVGSLAGCVIGGLVSMVLVPVIRGQMIELVPKRS